MYLKMPPGKWQPFCLDIDVLIDNRLLRNIWIYELADLKIHIEGIWMVLFYNQNLVIIILRYPGPRLNIKTVLSTYGDFHVKDKTAVRTSYL